MLPFCLCLTLRIHFFRRWYPAGYPVSNSAKYLVSRISGVPLFNTIRSMQHQRWISGQILIFGPSLRTLVAGGPCIDKKMFCFLVKTFKSSIICKLLHFVSKQKYKVYKGSNHFSKVGLSTYQTLSLFKFIPLL